MMSTAPRATPTDTTSWRALVIGVICAVVTTIGALSASTLPQWIAEPLHSSMGVIALVGLAFGIAAVRTVSLDDSGDTRKTPAVLGVLLSAVSLVVIVVITLSS